MIAGLLFFLSHGLGTLPAARTVKNNRATYLVGRTDPHPTYVLGR